MQFLHRNPKIYIKGEQAGAVSFTCLASPAAAALIKSKAVPTVDTFKGCIDIIQATRPLLVVLENVPRIDCPMDEEACLV